MQIFAEVLFSQSFDVAFASDGATALEQIRQQMPDVVILDAVMPGMSGFAVCEALKADPATRDIPILFMTALTEVTDRLRGFAVGAADYLVKPFGHEELLARVKTHLMLRLTLRALAEKNAALEQELAERARSERERAALQAQIHAAQETRLAEMSTPIIPITDTILVMPLIGMLDEARAGRVLEAALTRAAESRAALMILDITGVPRVDRAAVAAIATTAGALKLLGVRTVLTGVRPDVASAWVEFDVDFKHIVTHSTLQAGIAQALLRRPVRGAG